MAFEVLQVFESWRLVSMMVQICVFGLRVLQVLRLETCFGFGGLRFVCLLSFLDDVTVFSV